MAVYDSELALLCQAQTRLFALPLPPIVETMRALPTEPMPGVPDFVRGLSVIRGEPVPVVDLARLFGEQNSDPARFVTLAIDDRLAALAVDAVLGVRQIPASSLQPLPPLFQNVDAASAIGTLDAGLLLVLNATRLVPEEVWSALAQGTASP